jgi:hypothetical protein
LYEISFITMNTIKVEIDISSPVGKRLLKEIEKHPGIVKVEKQHPDTLAGQKTYTVDEVFEECYDILSEHYKCDVRKL